MTPEGIDLTTSFEALCKLLQLGGLEDVSQVVWFRDLRVGELFHWRLKGSMNALLCRKAAHDLYEVLEGDERGVRDAIGDQYVIVVPVATRDSLQLQEHDS